ncbi:hypothetical protein [Nakamurella deserti]|uniref:hypothetical protein n=1 Tax=Nakamurella deserti TaxID=2164074 RepID=UPI000DBE401A|nr:hypothetical protein [Nakamurella deserti]
MWSDGTRERPFEDYPPWSWVAEMSEGFFDWDVRPGDPRSGRYEVEWMNADDARRAWAELSIRPEYF